MHVIQIIGTLAREAAGPSYSVRRLAEALAARGVVSEILSLGEPGEQDLGGARSRVFGVEARRLPGLDSLLPSLGMAAAIEEAARAGAVLHNHGLWRLPNIYPARAARRHGAPLIVSPRGMLSEAALAYSRWPKRAFWHAMQKRALEAATCFHATSAEEARDIGRAGLGQPVAQIPNGIDVADADAVAAGKVGRATAGPRTLLQLGRLHPIKRIDRLLEAWARLEGKHPDWQLRIVGPSEGSHRQELLALAGQLGVARVAIELEVYGAAKERAFREADLLVLASASENFGMVVAEALANGTPVIATKGTPWQGLPSQGCGWWIDHGVEPLTAALDTAMALDRASLDFMGARGRQWMLDAFSWVRVAADMEAVYRWAGNGDTRPSSVHAA
jgi:glycosyltransferase involved in cell wall biosynthesis